MTTGPHVAARAGITDLLKHPLPSVGRLLRCTGCMATSVGAPLRRSGRPLPPLPKAPWRGLTSNGRHVPSHLLPDPEVSTSAPCSGSTAPRVKACVSLVSVAWPSSWEGFGSCCVSWRERSLASSPRQNLAGADSSGGSVGQGAATCRRLA